MQTFLLSAALTFVGPFTIAMFLGTLGAMTETEPKPGTMIFGTLLTMLSGGVMGCILDALLS